MPLPVPDAPLVTVSHETLAVAVHAQVPADAVNATVPEPPVSATFCPVGAIEKVHGGGGGAVWETVNVWPPTVSVPVRAAPALTAALNATVPLPVPDAPPVIVNHETFATAVHAQVPAEAVSATDPEPPVSAIVWPVGAIVNVHAGGGGAAWVIVNVFPAAEMVAVRTLVPVLAATENATVPLPVPDAPAVMAIHATLVVAVQAQLAADAVTAIEPVAPASATSCDVGEIENAHAGGGAAACVIVNVLPATVIAALRAAPVFAAT